MKAISGLITDKILEAKSQLIERRIDMKRWSPPRRGLPESKYSLITRQNWSKGEGMHSISSVTFIVIHQLDRLWYPDNGSDPSLAIATMAF